MCPIAARELTIYILQPKGYGVCRFISICMAAFCTKFTDESIHIYNNPGRPKEAAAHVWPIS